MNDEEIGLIYFRRPIPKPLTIKNINSASDEDVDQLVFDGIERLLVKCNYDNTKLLSLLPVGAKALFLTWVVEGQVNNGGFNQFYGNGYGAYADEAYKSFLYFGATEHAEVMLEAIKARKSERFKISLLKLIGTSKALSYSYKISKLNAVDEKFYEIKESLTKLRVLKIRENAEIFLATGDCIKA